MKTKHNIQKYSASIVHCKLSVVYSWWLADWELHPTATVHCHKEENIIQHIANPGKYQNSKFDVSFLVNAFSFCTIVKLKKMISWTIKSLYFGCCFSTSCPKNFYSFVTWILFVSNFYETLEKRMALYHVLILNVVKV